MVANISYGCNSVGALMYNEGKVTDGVAKHLFDSNLQSTNIYFKGAVIQAMGENSKVTDYTFHASLNLPPTEREITDEEFKEIAKEYMDKMGYKDIPYSVYRHFDTSHQHIHIVSSRIDDNNKLVNNQFEFKKSKDIIGEIETKFGLINAPVIKGEKSNLMVNSNGELINTQGTKGTIAKVLKEVKDKMYFNDFNSFKQILKAHSIEVAEVHKTEGVTGLVYILNTNGKEHKPVKASEIYHSSTYKTINEIAAKNARKKQPDLKDVKKRFEVFLNKYEALSKNKNQYYNQQFVPLLSEYKDGKIYGVSFFDKQTGAVYKGSDLINNSKENLIPKFDRNELLISTEFFNDKFIRESYFELRKKMFDEFPKESDFINNISSSELCSHIVQNHSIGTNENNLIIIQTIQLKSEAFLQERKADIISISEKENQNLEIKNTVSKIISDTSKITGPQKLKDYFIRQDIANKLPEGNLLRNMFLKTPALLNSILEEKNKIVNTFLAKKIPLEELYKNLIKNSDFIKDEIKNIPVFEKELKSDIHLFYKEYLEKNILTDIKENIFAAEIKDKFPKETYLPDSKIADLLASQYSFINESDKPLFKEIFKEKNINAYAEFILTNRIELEQTIKPNANINTRILENWNEIKEALIKIGPTVKNEIIVNIALEKSKQTVFADTIKYSYNLSDKAFKEKYKAIISLLDTKTVTRLQSNAKEQFIKKSVNDYLNNRLLQSHKENRTKNTNQPFSETAIKFKNDHKTNEDLKKLLFTEVSKVCLIDPNTLKLKIQENSEKYYAILTKKIPEYQTNELLDKAIKTLYTKYIQDNKIPVSKEGQALINFVNKLKNDPNVIITSNNFTSLLKEIEAKSKIELTREKLVDQLNSRITKYANNRLDFLQKQYPKSNRQYNQLKNALVSSKGGYTDALGVKKPKSHEEENER